MKPNRKKKTMFNVLHVHKLDLVKAGNNNEEKEKNKKNKNFLINDY